MEQELPFMVHLKNQPTCILLLSSLGFLSLLRFSIAFLRWVYVTFLRPGKNLMEYGSWGLVTGSTDGIGKAFAFHLAQKGLNLVLVGRNPGKLKQVSDAIKAEFGSTQIETVVVDLAGDLVDGIRRLEETIRGLDIGILVNSAGTTYPNALYFHEVEEELWRGIVKVNVEGTTRVTQAVLQGMMERKRGAVVNIGSASSVVIPSFPLYAVYAATKAYIDQFSRSIYVEYKKSGIDVQCQVPLYVATKMVSITRPSSFTPTPNGYAGVAMRWIGYEPRCTPYWPHSLQWCFCSLLPDFALNSWRLHVGISKRRLQKDS